MSALTWLGLGNLMVATPLALVAWLTGRYLRRPAVTHGLWVLVLLKLVTPPLGIVSVGGFGEPEPPVDVIVSQSAPEEAAGLPTVRIAETESVTVEATHSPVAASGTVGGGQSVSLESLTYDFSWIVPTLGAGWLIGAMACWLRGLRKCVAFQRLLNGAEVADEALQTRIARLADELQVRVPRTVLTAGTLSPLLWVWGRDATLVLPRTLFEQLPPEQQTTLLVHELAHWKRGDHWVRRLECLAGGLYWWCPLVWWALAEIRQAEEELCDAWVVATVPGSARDYALALVETVDFLAGCPSLSPPLASGLGPFPSLQRRLTMIFRTGTPRRLTFAGFAGLVALGGLLLTWTPAPSVAQDDPPMRKKKDFGPRGGGDEQIDGRLKELNAAMEKLRAEAEKLRAAQREQRENKEPKEDRGGAGRDDEEAQQKLQELQKMREKLKARLAELEQAGDKDEANKLREKLRDRVIELKKRPDAGPDGDLQKLRQELEAKRGELEKMSRELEKKAKELEALGKQLGEKGEKFRFEFKFPGNFGPGNYGPPNFGQRKPGGDANPNSNPNQRGDARPEPTPRAGGDVERRLDEMERKLDMLLREMRQGGQGGPGGPPRRGPGGPGGGDNPPRSKDGKEKAFFEIELNLSNDDNRGLGKVLNRRQEPNAAPQGGRHVDGFAPAPVAPRRVDQD